MGVVTARGSVAGVRAKLLEWEGLPELYELVIEEQTSTYGEVSIHVGVSWLKVGRAHKGLGDPESASEALDLAEEILVQIPRARGKLVEVAGIRVLMALEEGDIARALEGAREARETLASDLASELAAAYLWLADAYAARAAGELAAVDTAFEEALLAA